MQKTYLFAGASSAIAQHAAAMLTSNGHRVVGLSRNPLDGVYTKTLLMTDYDQAPFPEVDEPLHGLVYFPGSINLKPFNRLQAADFQRDYAINALGAARFVQHYLPAIRKSDSASVVFISSVAASAGLPFHASIAMAKAAVEGLTRALAAELAPTIRVNCIAPSMVETPLTARFIDTPEKRDQLAKRNALRKIGTPADIASMITFLLQEESSWITGQVLGIDGGMSSLRH